MNEQVGFWILVSGAVLAAIGSLWLVVRAFRTSIWWGLFVLLVPVVGSLVFLIVHPPRAKLPISLILLGAVVGFLPVVLNQLLGERKAKVSFETDKQIVTRGAINPMFDEMLAKTDVESASFARIEFTDELAERLSKFTKLKMLDLSDSAITDKSLSVIAKLPVLEVLRLSRVKEITNDGVKELLKTAITLKEIDTRGTAVNVETLREWRKGNAERKSNPK